MRKLAVIGQGRLGRTVRSDHYDIVFVGRNEPIPQADIVVCAVPGHAFEELKPELLKLTVPVIIASTGQTMDANPKSPWIYGRNFSLMVQAMRRAMTILGQSLPDGITATMSETHQAAKKDAPSGTALMLREAMGTPDMEIESLRIGEALPEHTVRVATPYEEVTIAHHVKNRDTYGQGIIWLADRLTGGFRLAPGLHSFEDVFDAITGHQDQAPARRAV